jgi:hypothetical protein
MEIGDLKNPKNGDVIFERCKQIVRIIRHEIKASAFEDSASELAANIVALEMLTTAMLWTIKEAGLNMQDFWKMFADGVQGAITLNALEGGVNE